MKTKQSFHVVLIKPSHYDDEGYVIQWGRPALPSNSLAALNALVMDCVARQVLGQNVSIHVEAYDETHFTIPTKRIIKRIRKGLGGIIGFVGVQTNQFPRSLDLGKPFLEAGIPVVIGGFHVSGCYSMLKEMPPDIQQALADGFTLVAGEAEGHLETILKDAYEKRLKPSYNFLNNTPAL
ncbi:MAG: radical SAM protein, partial [Nitrospirales bacterium]